MWSSHISFPCVPQNFLANCENTTTLLLSPVDHFCRQNYFQVSPYPSRVILNWNCCRCQMELWKCLIKMISVTVSENHFSVLIWYICDWRVAISCFEKMTLRTYNLKKKKKEWVHIKWQWFYYSSDIFFWSVWLLLHMYVIFHFNKHFLPYFFCIRHEWIKIRNTFSII